MTQKEFAKPEKGPKKTQNQNKDPKRGGEDPKKKRGRKIENK